MSAFDVTRATAERPVVVIGAGIAGAATAYRLHQRGVPVLLVERSDHIGGRMDSVDRHEGRFETGQQFYYSSYREVRRLLRELDLEHHLLPAPVRGYMCWEGRTTTFDKTKPWLDLLSARENLSLWAAVARKGWTMLRNSVFDFRANDPDDLVDVAEYFGRRVSKAVLELAVRPMVTSYSFAEPEGHSLSMLLRILKLGALAKTLALTQGNDALPKALAARVPGLRGAVQSIDLDAGEVSSVTVDGRAIPTHHVVCAAPPPSAHPLFAASSPALAEKLAAIEYTSTIMVNLALDQRLPGDGWVYTLSRHDGHRAAFAIDCLKRCPPCFPKDKSVLMVSFVNPLAAALMQRSDEELTRIAIDDMKIYLPSLGAMVKDVSVVRRRIAVPAFQTGTFRQIRAAQADSRAIQGLRLVGDYLKTPLIEGAVRSTLG
jgi:protoporphyrinogen/coproporphyrinogen III oxidase